MDSLFSSVRQWKSKQISSKILDLTDVKLRLRVGTES